MRATFEVGEVRVYPALPVDHILGLLCFARVRVGAYIFDSLQVRRDRAGEAFVRWPSHRDAAGVEHDYVQVADITVRGAVKQAVEKAVLAAARGEGLIP